MVEWTKEEWEEKIRDNEMVECTKCEKWFHLKCVNYDGTLEKAQQDENWKCGICDKKKMDVQQGLMQQFGFEGVCSTSSIRKARV